MSLKVESAPGFMGPVQCSARAEAEEKKGAAMLRPSRRMAKLGLDLAGGAVPGDRGVAEVGFVGHVAGQRGVVAEDGVLGNLLMVSHALEKSPEVRFFLVPGSAAIAESLPDGFLAGLGVVLLVPFLEIRFAHGLRIAGSVVAGRFVLAGLRVVVDVEFRDFQDSLGALEAVGLRCVATEIQPHINRHASVVEERGVDIGHVAAVRETENAAKGHGALGRLVPAKHVVHAADEVHEQVAGEAGAVFFPAAPAREVLGRSVWIPRPLCGDALPSVPIEIGEREIGWRRIFPGAGGIVAAVRAFDERDSADDAVGEQFFGFSTDDGAHALRTDLYHAAGFFRGGDHGEAIGGGVRHGLFAVDIFAGVDGVNDDLLVPMIGDGGDEAVDFLVVEEIFVAAGGGDFLADNFLRERVAAVVEIAGGDAFDAGQLNGFAKQAGALHADTDDAKANTVARRDGLQRQRNVLGLKKDCGRRCQGASGSGTALQEFAAGKIFFHDALLKKVDGAKLKVQTKTAEQSAAALQDYFSGWTLTSLKKTTSFSL